MQANISGGFREAAGVPAASAQGAATSAAAAPPVAALSPLQGRWLEAEFMHKIKFPELTAARCVEVLTAKLASRDVSKCAKQFLERYAGGQRPARANKDKAEQIIGIAFQQ